MMNFARMRFIVTTAIVFLSLCAVATAQPAFPAANKTPQFAGVKWRLPIDDVLVKMAARGFALDEARTTADADGDLWFTGAIHGEPALVIAFFDAQRRLVKTQVDIITPDEQCAGAFATSLRELRDAYGTPDLAMQEIAVPYAFNTAGFTQAVSHEKALYYARWNGPENNSYAVSVMVMKNLTVEVAYESDAWNAELLRRESLAVSAFTPEVALQHH